MMRDVSDSYASPDKVAVHPIEPTLNTRPPRGPPNRTMSERTAGLVIPLLHGVFNSVSSMALVRTAGTQHSRWQIGRTTELTSAHENGRTLQGPAL